MTITISYCDMCKRRGDQVKAHLAPRLKKEFPEAEFVVQCLSFCGPGSKKPFVYVNDELIYAETDDELIQEIKDYIKQL